VTENKKQINVPQYKKDNFLCDITKYDFWICCILQVFPKQKEQQKSGSLLLSKKIHKSGVQKI
jgi:hypothetical protein